MRLSQKGSVGFCLVRGEGPPAILMFNLNDTASLRCFIENLLKK
jgi:hypothetical protein